MLKLFVQDRGVYGMSVVVAETREEATEMIRKGSAYGTLDTTSPIVEMVIMKGTEIHNLGDQ